MLSSRGNRSFSITSSGSKGGSNASSTRCKPFNNHGFYWPTTTFLIDEQITHQRSVRSEVASSLFKKKPVRQVNSNEDERPVDVIPQQQQQPSSSKQDQPPQQVQSQRNSEEQKRRYLQRRRSIDHQLIRTTTKRNIEIKKNLDRRSISCKTIKATSKS